MTMRLKSIKLAGFKSFVDPTVLPINNQLVGVVGPNGCGKSNVIDAVRWVMGGTAKNIRGGVSTDVIFSGSTARKPVGQASVELTFDNSDGKLGGEYAQYAEICVKRSINRDGISTYYLNGAKCRLTDISNIFLGTGMGPKSYAIIEQGMISRVVEAKPEELRVFVEEAAGISKYKARRRETENRIRHTRENLDRLNDLREELEKQLQRLHRQSQAAEKYKRLKAEQKQLKISLTVINLKDIQEELATLNSNILNYNTELEGAFTDLQHLRTESEKLRLEQHEANDKTEQVQKRYYDLGTKIATHEQQLSHLQEQKKQCESNIAEIQHMLEQKRSQLEDNIEKLEAITEEKSENEPVYQETLAALEQIQETLQSCEEELGQTHSAYQDIQQAMLVPAKVAEGEKTTITQLEKQIHEKAQRKEKLESDLSSLNFTMQDELLVLQEKELECIEAKEQAQQLFEESKQSLLETEGSLKQSQNTLQENEKAFIDTRAQLNALTKVQENALGKEDKEQQAWLDQKGLSSKARLVEKIDVEPVWAVAIETVLDELLQAITIDSSEYPEFVQNLGNEDVLANITLWEQGNSIDCQGLLQHIKNHSDLPHGVACLLANVHCAQTIKEAIEQSNQAQNNQSYITSSGIWAGRGWIKGKQFQENQESLIEREQAISHLQEQCRSLEEVVESSRQQVDEYIDRLASCKQKLNDADADQQRYHSELLNLQGEIKLKQNQYTNDLQRKERLQSDIQECNLFIEEAQIEVNRSRTKLSESLDKMEQLTTTHQDIQRKLRQLEQDHQPLKLKAKELKDQSHELSLVLNNQSNQISNLNSQIEQTKNDIEEYTVKSETLREQFEDLGEPIYELETTLQEECEARVDIEKDLNAARDVSAHIENQLNQKMKTKQDTEEHINTVKDTLTNIKMRVERLTVQKENEDKQLKELNISLEEAHAQCIADLDKHEGQERVEQIEKSVSRLGPINLAAIEEFESAQERKIYLDTQNDDLTEALQTLEEAINKIDKETRQKFKDTFDMIDEGFKTLFPKLFGGGEAKLILTGDDLLDTGVNIIARPPGKRNTTIQQLSGGEKALTAVSLVFSIFQLNPAPFCLLDEVDAPLDDNNVGRFCDMVKEMAKKVQFIYISHNKLAIEMAEALHGVTMREAGVSRLVSVDIEKATKMAELDAKEEA